MIRIYAPAEVAHYALLALRQHKRSKLHPARSQNFSNLPRLLASSALHSRSLDPLRIVTFCLRSCRMASINPALRLEVKRIYKGRQKSHTRHHYEYF